jgi:hypothetical protein
MLFYLFIYSDKEKQGVYLEIRCNISKDQSYSLEITPPLFLLECTIPWKTPMMTDLKKLRDSDPVEPSLYRQLVGSLMYLENTQLAICLVGCLSYDIQLHGFIDSNWVGSADDIRSATWICFSLRFAMMSWDSRK